MVDHDINGTADTALANYAVWTDRGAVSATLTYVLAHSTSEARAKVLQADPEATIIRIRRGRNVATTPARE